MDGKKVCGSQLEREMERVTARESGGREGGSRDEGGEREKWMFS